MRAVHRPRPRTLPPPSDAHARRDRRARRWRAPSALLSPRARPRDRRRARCDDRARSGAGEREPGARDTADLRVSGLGVRAVRASGEPDAAATLRAAGALLLGANSRTDPQPRLVSRPGAASHSTGGDCLRGALNWFVGSAIASLLAMNAKEPPPGRRGDRGDAGARDCERLVLPARGVHAALQAAEARRAAAHARRESSAAAPRCWPGRHPEAARLPALMTAYEGRRRGSARMADEPADAAAGFSLLCAKSLATGSWLRRCRRGADPLCVALLAATISARRYRAARIRADLRVLPRDMLRRLLPRRSPCDTSRLAQLAIAVATISAVLFVSMPVLAKLDALPGFLAFRLFLLGGLLSLLALVLGLHRALHHAPVEGARGPRARVGGMRSRGGGDRRDGRFGRAVRERAADQRHHHRPDGSAPVRGACERSGQRRARHELSRRGVREPAARGLPRSRADRRRGLARRRVRGRARPRSRATAGRSSPPTPTPARSRPPTLADLPLRRRHRRARAPAAHGRAIDVRSKSRVGKGDMGANAARIRRLRDAFG